MDGATPLSSHTLRNPVSARHSNYRGQDLSQTGPSHGAHFGVRLLAVEFKGHSEYGRYQTSRLISVPSRG
jgi:hypothetical protein